MTLDLQTLDEALARPGNVRDGQSRAWIVQLLSLLRETRAALYPFVVASQPSSPLLDRALAALGQAVEGG